MTALQKSDGQEWIEWNGGVCPVPVETLVMTKLRNGWQSHGPAMAGYHRWDHGRTPDSPLRSNDIIAYRVVVIGHTDGPWLADGPDMFGDYNIVRSDGVDALAIAAVVSNMRPAEEVAANANLVAAATELLDALRALLVFAEAAETKALVGDEGCLWPVEKARDAVARATGQ